LAIESFNEALDDAGIEVKDVQAARLQRAGGMYFRNR